jgi:hypothetical protein
MKYLFIYRIWIDCTISITIEKFDLNVISQKTYGQVFHSNEHKCVGKKHFVEKWISFKRWQELCWRSLDQNLFYMFIEMSNEIKENLAPKYIPQKIHFLA